MLYTQIQASISKGAGPQLPTDTKLVLPNPIYQKLSKISNEVSSLHSQLTLSPIVG